MSRPSSFTQEIADEICARIAKGDSLRSICANDDFLPSERTIYRWLDDNEAFCQQYARAREMQADAKFDEAWQIATSATPESVQVARLQIDTIKWQTGKLAPKKYGDKVDATVKHEGQVGLTIISGVPRDDG